jgi:hypothetical protein
VAVGKVSRADHDPVQDLPCCHAGGVISVIVTKN